MSAAQEGVGADEFGARVGAHPSSTTWKEQEGDYFSVVCNGRMNSMS